MFRKLFALQSLLSAACAISQSCIWKNGQIADLYRPCNDSATTGACCQQGETCLASGLCQGSQGLVYRGACINEWDPEKCLTYCDDKSPVFSNLYPCTGDGGLGAPGPLFWWCGSDLEQTCSTKNGTRMRINPGLPIRILTDQLPKTPTNSPPSSTSTSSSESLTSATSLPTSSSTGLPTGSNPPQQPASTTEAFCAKEEAKVVAIGAGVGVPLGVLALVMFGLYLNERRLRRKIEGTAVLAKEPIGYSSPAKYSHSANLVATESRHQLGPEWRGHEMSDRQYEPREIGTSY